MSHGIRYCFELNRVVLSEESWFVSCVLCWLCFVFLVMLKICCLVIIVRNTIVDATSLKRVPSQKWNNKNHFCQFYSNKWIHFLNQQPKMIRNSIEYFCCTLQFDKLGLKSNSTSSNLDSRGDLIARNQLYKRENIFSKQTAGNAYRIRLYPADIQVRNELPN